jgi:hypothetical protein
MKVFIASSSESLPLAMQLAEWLEEEKLKPVIWNNKDVFPVGEYTYESLLNISRDVQAAIIIMNTDDKVWYRDEIARQPRDNVLIEYGLFSAHLGTKRAIIVYSGKTKKASDLEGLNCIDASEDKLFSARKQIKIWSKNVISQTNDISNKFDQPCQVDWKISQRRASKTGINITSKDVSNLFFALLCVVDCQKSRIAIADLQARDFGQISIEAAYHLMGAWDLLIKFRAESNELAKKFYNELINTLAKRKMMKIDENERFDKGIILDIMAQSKTISNLLDPTDDEIISYVLLPNSSDYDTFRASRAFIIVQAIGDRGSKRRKAFLQELARQIEKSRSRSIIESICESESELVFEIMSTCSESNYINILNRDIEPVLSIHNLQKYTLLCYDYQESGLLDNSKSIMKPT